MILNQQNYLPHRGRMCLIDSILEVNEKCARCQTLITKNNIFYNPQIDGIYAWMGLEFMAQTAGIFAYFNDHSRENITNIEPKIGFLLSVRKFSCSQPHFKANDLLTIIADNEYLQDNLGVFQCSIILNDKLVAAAKLNALQPSAEELKNTMFDFLTS